MNLPTTAHRVSLGAQVGDLDDDGALDSGLVDVAGSGKLVTAAAAGTQEITARRALPEEGSRSSSSPVEDRPIGVVVRSNEHCVGEAMGGLVIVSQVATTAGTTTTIPITRSGSNAITQYFIRVDSKEDTQQNQGRIQLAGGLLVFICSHGWHVPFLPSFVCTSCSKENM